MPPLKSQKEKSLDRTQCFFLWALAVAPGPLKLSEIKPSLKPIAKRLELIELGFIEETKVKIKGQKGRRLLSIAPKGLNFLESQEGLNVLRSGPWSINHHLGQLIEKLLLVFKESEISLLNLIRPQNQNEASTVSLKPLEQVSNLAPLSFKQSLYLKLKELPLHLKTPGGAVRLETVRSLFNHIERRALDTALIELHRERKIILAPADDPGTLDLNQAQAALEMGGRLNHQLFAL